MFSKFVGRLRKRFANLFNDILRTQLLLKNIVSPEDWEQMSDHIQYDFLYDNHFAELKEAELLTNRLTLATTIEPYIGKYYSTEYVRKKYFVKLILRLLKLIFKLKTKLQKVFFQIQMLQLMKWVTRYQQIKDKELNRVPWRSSD